MTAESAGWTRGRRPWLWVAALCGSVHASFSAAWALGSDVLLGTVGDIAEVISAAGPQVRAAVLGVVAGGKSLVVVALLCEARGLPRPSGLRARILTTELIIGGALLAYGSVSMAGSGIGLLVELRREQPDPGAVTVLWGHLLIWDLLFALWGLGTVLHTRGRLREPHAAGLVGRPSA